MRIAVLNELPNSDGAEGDSKPGSSGASIPDGILLYSFTYSILYHSVYYYSSFRLRRFCLSSQDGDCGRCRAYGHDGEGNGPAGNGKGEADRDRSERAADESDERV